MDLYKRAKTYDYLSDIGKSLLDEIYGNRENFIKGIRVEFNKDKFSSTVEPHPLEEYVISYDQNLEDDGIVINMGERVGFNIVIDETEAYTPAEQFYDRCSYTIRKNSTERIKKIMNMTKKQFEQVLLKLNLRMTDEIYYDRLNIDSHKYSRKLIQSYYDIETQESLSTPEDNLTLYDEGIVTNVAQIKQDPESPLRKDLSEALEDEEDYAKGIKIDAERSELLGALDQKDTDLSDEEFDEDLEEEGEDHRF